jgi:hypothetical protein
VFCCLLWLPILSAQSRWKLAEDGGIAWEVKRGEAHQDQIEMSGRRISAIVTYGVRETGALTLTRQVVFPWLRTLPNDTHASLAYTFADDATPRVFIAGRPARETIVRFHHRGMITVESTMGTVALTRTIFPSVDKPFLIEKYDFAMPPSRLRTPNTPCAQPLRAASPASTSSPHRSSTPGRRP